MAICSYLWQSQRLSSLELCSGIPLVVRIKAEPYLETALCAMRDSRERNEPPRCGESYKSGRNNSERSINAPFRQRCKNKLIVCRSILQSWRRKPNEAASDDRPYLLCLWARANHACVGSRAWVGPSWRSRPPLRLGSGPPLWLGASSPLMVIFTLKSQKGAAVVGGLFFAECDQSRTFAIRSLSLINRT